MRLAMMEAGINPFVYLRLVLAFIGPFMPLKPVIGAFANPYAVGVTASVPVKGMPVCNAAIGVGKVCRL